MKKNKNINTNNITKFYLIIPLILITILYFLLPRILNYPPNSIDNIFQKDIDGMTYTIQFILISSMCFIICTLMLMSTTRRINKLLNKLEHNKGDRQNIIKEITKLCLKLPIRLYVSQILVPLIFIPIVLSVIGAQFIVVLKISSVFILFLTISAVLSYVFSQAEFKKLIIKINENETYIESNIINEKPKISIKTKIILELLPLIIVSLLFTSLIAYTINSQVVGDLNYSSYKKELDSKFEEKVYTNKNEIINKLKEIELIDENSTQFIIDIYGNNYCLNNNIQLSNFFIKYLLNNSEQGRTYDYYCIDREGAFIEVETSTNDTYYVGILYATTSTAFINMLSISGITLLVLIFITLFYIAKSLGKDIDLITNGLNKIIEHNDLNYKLIVTSNDETGELTNSFNEIQQLTKNHINEIKEKQDLIVRQGKLSILGELAGGMAHDINNPASAINMSIDCLYNIDDKENKAKVLDNMKECIKRILAIVSSVRDQFRNSGVTKKEIFLLNNVFNNIKIVMQNQLNKYNCELEVNCKDNIKVYGEINKLNQVISNIIMNSILAYKDLNKKGKIDIRVNEEKDFNIISIKDEAGGIPENIRAQLFEKILTTRGTQGTGLGLYLARTIIEDEFNGKIYFETETNKGTIFYIKLKKMEE